MKKLLSIFALVAISLVVGVSVFAAQAVSKKALVVNVTRSFSGGQDLQPNGFVISVDGWTLTKVYVAEQVPALPSSSGIVEVSRGTVVGTIPFYHAGAYDYFTVVRAKDTVQVVREEADEVSPATRVHRHVVLSLYVPASIRVRMAPLAQ